MCRRGWTAQQTVQTVVRPTTTRCLRCLRVAVAAQPAHDPPLHLVASLTAECHSAASCKASQGPPCLRWDSQTGMLPRPCLTSCSDAVIPLPGCRLPGQRGGQQQAPCQDCAPADAAAGAATGAAARAATRAACRTAAHAGTHEHDGGGGEGCSGSRGAVLAGGYFFMVPKGNITEATVCALSPSATTKRIYKLSLQSLQSRRHTFPSNSLLVSQLSTWVSPSRR